MAEAGGTEDDPLAPEGGQAEDAGRLDAVSALSADPYGWQFFAAVRAMQTARGERPSVGRSTRIEHDFLRFKQEPSLSFQASELVGFERSEQASAPAWAMRQTFFGLFGPNGPLPSHITEDAIIDINGPRHHRLLPDFCDLLQHRMTSLLYRAWEATQLAASRDLGGTDPYMRYISALFGAAPAAFRDREALPDDTKRFMAGWLADKHGSVAALESVVEIVTGHPARVEQFVGEWLPIPVDEQTGFPVHRKRLGPSKPPPRLGVDTVIGARTFTVQNRLAIRTARLGFAAYDALLPDGEIFPQIRDGVRHVIGLGMAWELRPILKVNEIPQLSLDGERRLGWDTWLDPGNRTRDGDELVIEGTTVSQISKAA